MLRAQRILAATAWTALAVGLVAFLRPDGLLELSGLILASLP